MARTTQGNGGTAARSIGPSGRVAAYRVADGDMAMGSTLGSLKVCTVIKATGAIEKVYSIDLGEDVFGTLVLHHWDEQTGMRLDALNGVFTLHPERQERDFEFANGVSVHEDIFVLSGPPDPKGAVDPPATYYTVELHNSGSETVRIATYAFCQVGGMTTEQTGKDIAARYDEQLGAIIAWDQSAPDHTRVFGGVPKPESAQAAVDHALAVSRSYPGRLTDDSMGTPRDRLSAVRHSHELRPGGSARFYYLLSFSGRGQEAAIQTYRSCPDADAARERTMRHYHDVLGRTMVVTPSTQVNQGVLWAKANMLRTEIRPPMGWSFTNNPTESSNCVARDASWFCFGADYITPYFSRELLRSFQRLSSRDFWTPGGLRVAPRDAPTYSPNQGSGLLGGVWVGVSYWFAFAAARFAPSLMEFALRNGFENYARDPRRNNTVPGQFSEWLDGETLVNKGMMLSPWFPPRYVWAAVEGAAGLDLSSRTARPQPHLSPDWKWLAVRNVPFHGHDLAWLTVRTPDLTIYTTHQFADSPAHEVYDEDISASVQTSDPAVESLGLRRVRDLLLFVGNTDEYATTTGVSVEDVVSGAFRRRTYDSLVGSLRDHDHVSADELREGIGVRIERKGFVLFDLAHQG